MLCPSSIWRRDLNPQPSEQESPPIATRPGFPPNLIKSPFPAPFFFIIVFSILLTVNVQNKFTRYWIQTADLWTALPTEPQPLPLHVLHDTVAS